VPVLSIENAKVFCTKNKIFFYCFLCILTDGRRFTALALYHAKAPTAFVNMHKRGLGFGTLVVQNDETGAAWFFSSTK
jgi:hypothetical protein